MEELGPIMPKVIKVSIAHPVREVGKVKVGHCLDGINADALLTCVSPLLPDNGRLQGRRSHDQHHELDMVKSLGDLEPPIPSPFQPDAILPKRNVLSLQAFA